MRELRINRSRHLLASIRFRWRCLPLLAAWAALGLAQSADVPSVAPSKIPPWGEYVTVDDKAFHWEAKTALDASTGRTTIKAKVISQVWGDSTWDHDVTLVVPKARKADDLVLALLSGTLPGKDLQQTADITGIACMTVSGIENETTKDQKKCMANAYQTGDLTRTPVCPWTKSMVKVMDAVEAMTARDLQKPIRRFILAGHSKFGCTAWTAATIDPRVVAIAPLGSDDILCLKTQLEAKFGDHLDPKLNTDVGRHWVVACDVNTYRQSLTIPKLISQGVNDPNSVFASSSLYWDTMPGSNRLLLLPNIGHEWTSASNNATLAFVQCVATGKSLPELHWRSTDATGKRELRVTSNEVAKGARLWIATGPKPDLRKATWTSAPMTEDPAATGKDGVVAAFMATADKPATGCLAVFGELDFERDGLTFSLTTTIAADDPPRVP